jgi:hypothetical protein
VQERSDFDQDVLTKSKEFKAAKVVMVMSRFTVLLQGKTLLVVPTADITEFRTIKPLDIITSQPSPKVALPPLSTPSGAPGSSSK